MKSGYQIYIFQYQAVFWERTRDFCRLRWRTWGHWRDPWSTVCWTWLDIRCVCRCRKSIWRIWGRIQWAASRPDRTYRWTSCTFCSRSLRPWALSRRRVPGCIAGTLGSNRARLEFWRLIYWLYNLGRESKLCGLFGNLKSIRYRNR